MRSSLYCSLSQNSEKFNTSMQSKPSVFVILGNFNPRLTSFWSNDIDTAEGAKCFSLSALNGFKQTLSEPRHIQRNNSSCKGLFLMTNQVWLLIAASTHHYIQVVTIKSYIVTLYF